MRIILIKIVQSKVELILKKIIIHSLKDRLKLNKRIIMIPLRIRVFLMIFNLLEFKNYSPVKGSSENIV